MSLSKKNTGLFILVALILVVALFAMMLTVTSYAEMLPWSSATHVVAHCAGSTCSIG